MKSSIVLRVSLAAVLCSATLSVTLAPPLAAQGPSYPPEMPRTQVEVYKKVGDTELQIWSCLPEGHSASDKRPAMVFFFGGGWRSGTPSQFLPHCQYLAGRGMVAAIADYRVADRHGVTVGECVKDAKAAVRWLRSNASRLGIDPERIGAGGGSAGGHLAAATALLPGYDDSPESPVRATPDALALFNPAVVLAPISGREGVSTTDVDENRARQLRKRLGAEPESLSPYHHVREGLPPSIVFHGTADTVVAHATVEAFQRALERAGNQTELVSYEGEGHGFFNQGRGDGSAYVDTIARLDRFLVTLGWL